MRKNNKPIRILKTYLLSACTIALLSACNDTTDETDDNDNGAISETYFDTTNPPNFDIVLPETSGPIAKLAASEPVTDPVSPEANHAIIYYVTKPGDTDYSQYSLYTWNNDSCDRSDETWLKDWSDVTNSPTGIDQYGPYWDIPLKDGNTDCINIIIRDKDLSNTLGSEASPSLSSNNYNIALIAGSTTAYKNREQAFIELSGISNAQAHLIASNQLVWKNAPSNASEYRLYVSLDGKIQLNDNYEYTQPYIVLSASSLSAEQQSQFPQLKDDSLIFTFDNTINSRNVIKAQLVAIAVDD